MRQQTTNLHWILMNKPQRNLNCNSIIFIHENALESVVCEMVVIFSRPQSVKRDSPGIPQLIISLNGPFSAYQFAQYESGPP